MEELRIVNSSQSLQVGGHRRRQAVVDLVPGRPQRIATGGRQSVDLQHGVVGRHGLERDICVPACARESADIRQLVGEASAFLLLLAADDRDLVAELGALFCQGMDVQAGRFGTSREGSYAEHEVFHLIWCDILISKEDDTALRD